MPQSFVTGLDDQVRHKMVDLLNDTLSDTIALTLAVKQAHWNLKGPGFIGVHELLDEVAERLRDGADLMAERVAILGGLARGTLEDAAQNSDIAPYPAEAVDIEEHIDALVERFTTFGDKLRQAIETAADAGDPDTEDLLTEVSRNVDKDAWFIGSNKKAS